MAAGKIVDAGEATGRPAGPGSARRRRARARRPGGDGRWVREVKGILALALAGFGLAALYAFDPPGIHLTSRARWARWGSGWAGPPSGPSATRATSSRCCSSLYGAGAFVRARSRGAGPGSSASSCSSSASPASSRATRTRWRRSASTRVACSAGRWSRRSAPTVGGVGSWIILLAHPAGGRCSSSRRPRSAACPAASRPPGRVEAGSATAAARADWTMLMQNQRHQKQAAIPEKACTPPPLIVKEPPKAKSGLVEKGLAWQETFDFG